MTFSWINHIRKLYQRSILVFKCMITRLWTVSCPSSNENSSVFSLNRTKSNWDIEFNVKKFSCFLVSFDVIEGQNSLVKLEEMNLIGYWFITVSSLKDLCSTQIRSICSKLRSPNTSKLVLCICSLTKLLSVTHYWVRVFSKLLDQRRIWSALLNLLL